MVVPPLSIPDCSPFVLVTRQELSDRRSTKILAKFLSGVKILDRMLGEAGHAKAKSGQKMLALLVRYVYLFRLVVSCGPFPLFVWSGFATGADCL